MNELHLFQYSRLARLAGSEKQHLDLIPQIYLVSLQLVLDLFIPRFALLGFRALIAAHYDDVR